MTTIIKTDKDISNWTMKNKRVISIGSRGDWCVHPREGDPRTSQCYGRTAQSAIRKAEREMREYLK